MKRYVMFVMSLAISASLHAKLSITDVNSEDLLIKKDADSENFQNNPAVFEITQEIINENLEPFTVTVGGFGNTLKRQGMSGFEPVVFRNKFYIREDCLDIIPFNSTSLTHYDSYQSGYLDGAEVFVYRITDGKFEMVREAKVKETVIEYWNVSNSKVIDPTVKDGEYGWDSWSRRTAERWISVFSVDKNGNLSKASNSFKIKFAEPAEGASSNNEYINFKVPRNASNDSQPVAPENLKVTLDEERNIYKLKWDLVDSPDIAGYAIGVTDTDPSKHRGTYIELEKSPNSVPLKKGDMVFVSKIINIGNPSELFSNRLGNLDRILRGFVPAGVPNDYVISDSWKIVKHKKDTPVTDSGSYYLEITPEDGKPAHVGHFGIPDISTTQQDYYPVPEEKEYKMEVWVKADKDNAPPVVFEWNGDARVGGFVGKTPFQPTTKWQKFEHTFMGKPSDEGHHAYFVITCQPGATYAFDNFRVYRADTEYLDFTKKDYERIEHSGMMSLRTHGPIKTGTQTYNMDAYLSSAGSNPRANGNTLPQMLTSFKKANVYPWLQIEYHMSPDEWLAFAEYMLATYDPKVDTPEDKPWAYKRYKQGHAEPWVDEFDRIYFELANETWNGLFRPWVFSDMADAKTLQEYKRGEVYAKMHDYVVEIMRSSPYWNQKAEDKFIHVLGGWAIGSYSQEIINTTKNGDFVTIAAYNGGWDEGEGPVQETPASFFNVLAQVNQTAIPRARQYAAMAVEARKAGKDIKLGTYEAGPGYALNGLNNAVVSKEQKRQQENVMKSKVAGTATIDSFLARSYYDFDLQNFFTFSEGDLWKSHAKSYRGGQPYPSFMTLSIFNRLATGDMLATKTISVPTVDLPKAKRRQEVKDAPLAAVYATQNKDQLNVFCISRKIAGYPVKEDDGYTPFKVKLPITEAKSITLYKMSGEPTDNNIFSEKVKWEEVNIEPANIKDGYLEINKSTGGSEKGLPPAETYLYVIKK